MDLLSSKSPRFSLAQLVDLEYQLQHDQSQSRATLNDRDQVIGRLINAPSLNDRTLLIRWLEAVRGEEAPPPGRAVERIVDATRGFAVIAGLLVGVTTVATWLSIESGKPVNAVYFWGALVGLQIILLIVLGLGLLCPALFARALLAPAQMLVAAVMWIVSRFSFTQRDALRATAGMARQYERLYGRMRFWLLVQVTQLFTIALNAGLLVAFVALALVSDPAFGWRSTLMDAPTVHRLTRIVAVPWSWALPETELLLEEIQATRYSSLDPTYLATLPAHGGDVGAWAAWWPFLLLSLVVYGLLPRVLVGTVSTWRLRRALGQAPVDHAAVVELRQRLRRPFIDTRALEEELQPPSAPAAMVLAIEPATAHQVMLLAWPGVRADDTALRKLVSEALGASVTLLHRLGPAADAGEAAAMQAVRDLEVGVSVAMVVEAWEPPVGDYLDMLTALRSAAGPDRLLAVLLYHQEAADRIVPPLDGQLRQWTTRLQALGDPYLRVKPLLAEERP